MKTVNLTEYITSDNRILRILFVQVIIAIIYGIRSFFTHATEEDIMTESTSKSENFRLDEVIVYEGKRRYELLGRLTKIKVVQSDNEITDDTCVNESELAGCIRQRAREVNVPVKTIFEWHHHFQNGGERALQPSEWADMWNRLEGKEQKDIVAKYNAIKVLADSEVIANTHSEITTKIGELAISLGWGFRKTERLIRRYRQGGLLALAKNYNPEKPTPAKKIGSTSPTLGSLSDEDINLIVHRIQMLGDLAFTPRVTNAEIKKRATEMGVSPRTIRARHSDYHKRGGAIGLQRKTRCDAGFRHSISDRMVDIIVGLRLSNKGATDKRIHKEACKRARLLGEREPSESVTRDVIKSIDEATLLIAHGNEKGFRDKFRMTHEWIYADNFVSYQMDWTRANVLAKDKRSQRFKTKSEEIRAYIISIVATKESLPTLPVASRLFYDQPDKFAYASVLRDAFLYFGLPDEIRTDLGKPEMSNHLSEILKDLSISRPLNLRAHKPEQNGKVERFHDNLDDQLWSHVEGYLGKNIRQRLNNVRAVHSIQELNNMLQDKLNEIRHTIYKPMGITLIECWKQNTATTPIEADELDILLMVRERAIVHKDKVNYGGRGYWHQSLWPYIDKEVLIRAYPSYRTPGFHCYLFWWRAGLRGASD